MIIPDITDRCSPEFENFKVIDPKIRLPAPQMLLWLDLWTGTAVELIWMVVGFASSPDGTVISRVWHLQTTLGGIVPGIFCSWVDFRGSISDGRHGCVGSRRISWKSDHATHVQHRFNLACRPGSDIRGSFPRISRRPWSTGQVSFSSSPSTQPHHMASHKALRSPQIPSDVMRSSQIRQLFVLDFTCIYRQISKGF